MPSRRSFLAGSVAALGALAGCAGGDGDTTASTATESPSATDRTTTERTTTVRGVSDVSFSWYPDKHDYEPTADPSIAFEDGRVVVTGALYFGSSSCNRIALDSVTREDGDLRVAVEARQRRDQPTTCYSDMAAGDYRVTVTLTDRPARVVASEHSAENETHRTTTTLPD